MRLNNAWHKIYSGVYTDDLICFTTLLAFVNSFSSANELRRDLEMRPEHYNAAVCNELIRHYSIIKNRSSYSCVSQCTQCESERPQQYTINDAIMLKLL